MNANPTVDVVLRGYLLGTIDPGVRDEVEKRLFSEDRIFWEQLCLVEDELIDDYVNGELDDESARAFARCFLTTEERREKLQFARALKSHASRERANTGTGWKPFAMRLTFPAWGAVAAALVLALGPVLTWQMARPAPAGEVSAWLSSGLVRSVNTELPRVRIPEGAPIVRLRLDAGGNPYSSYRATLHDVNGGELWSQYSLVPSTVDGREAITLTLPSEVLPSGDYYVRLRGVVAEREPVVLDRYDFRVLR